MKALFFIFSISLFCRCGAAVTNSPPPDAAIKTANLILVGKFDSKDENLFHIREVLKSPIDLPEAISLVPLLRSSYKPPEAPIEKEVIFLGRWSVYHTFIRSYGEGSIWPDGIPKTFQSKVPSLNTGELIKYIKQQIAKEAAKVPPQPKQTP